MKDSGMIVFLGAGRMATAIAGGLLKNGFKKSNLAAFDISPEALEQFSASTGIDITFEDAETLLKKASTIILAVKPQHLAHALEGKTGLLKDKLVISIAAGVKLATLSKLTETQRIVRVMPNTPALIGAGVSAYAASSNATGEDIQLTEKILGAIGEFCRVQENLMDAVTGVSGCGPAYVFDFIQALADGGVNAGLPRQTALKLAAQTVAGAAQMVLQTACHPSELKDQVTSPGGATAKGLAILEKGAFRGLVSEAVLAATKRSAELGAE
ncbi:MAG: pyrroline-5-carboxylate reductase [Victivallaceae bacterium]